jgi:hypothetical protein
MFNSFRGWGFSNHGEMRPSLIQLAEPMLSPFSSCNFKGLTATKVSAESFRTITVVDAWGRPRLDGSSYSSGEALTVRFQGAAGDFFVLDVNSDALLAVPAAEAVPRCTAEKYVFKAVKALPLILSMVSTPTVVYSPLSGFKRLGGGSPA